MSIKNILQTFATESSYFQENYKEVSLTEYPELGDEYSLLLEGIESFDTVSELSNSETCQITNMEMSPLTSLIVFTEYFQHIVAVESIMDEKGCTMGEAFVALESYGINPALGTVYGTWGKLRTFFRTLGVWIDKLVTSFNRMIFGSDVYIIQEAKRIEKNLKYIKNYNIGKDTFESKYKSFPYNFLNMPYVDLFKTYSETLNVDKLIKLSNDIKEATSAKDLCKNLCKNLSDLISNDFTGDVSAIEIESMDPSIIKKLKDNNTIKSYFDSSIKNTSIELLSKKEAIPKVTGIAKDVLKMAQEYHANIKVVKKMELDLKTFSDEKIKSLATNDKDLEEIQKLIKFATSLVAVYMKKHKVYTTFITKMMVDLSKAVRTLDMDTEMQVFALADTTGVLQSIKNIYLVCKFINGYSGDKFLGRLNVLASSDYKKMIHDMEVEKTSKLK